MKTVCVGLLVALLALEFVPFATAAPVIPALSNKHPLTEIQVGNLLIGELRCLACHTRSDSAPVLDRAAPDLTDVGSRVSPEFLQKFIANPSSAHAGTTMPNVFASETAERRDKIAESISHFLIAQSLHKFHGEKTAEKEAMQGKEIFHTVGCAACHSPRDDNFKEITHEGVVELSHLPTKYSPASLAIFLYQPAKVRPSGRMPDMKLTPVEAKALASYLVGKGATVSKPLKTEVELVALGKAAFQKFNCTSCHKVGDLPAAAHVGDLQKVDSSRGCLSKTVGKSPRFELNDEQIEAIRATLAKKPEPNSDKTLLATTLIAFHCTACHTRDDYGGVSEDLNPYFQTGEKGLGDEARVPPPLTIVGAKLQPVALKKMLYDADSVRSYMYTRMPQFGEPNLRHLPDLFSKLDSLKSVEFSLPKPESNNPKEQAREKEMRAGGRELVGDKALNCIACHSFNGQAPNQKGIDLMVMTQRLQPSWYFQYMINPSAFRPRTVMPTSWPDGKAVITTIFHGDTHLQIEAIWYYLTFGISAADPSGVKLIESELAVTDTTRTYRGRSSVAGYRGIAVGFPEKINYAFNAETGTLSAIWQGGFVRVDRSGQGSGGFNPIGKHIALHQDVSFFALPDEKSPWPLRPVMTKQAPTNPDPLYPKNRGYQFEGYQLDDASIPTFFYRSGDIKIEDYSIVEKENKNACLVRKLSFDSPADETIWFRAFVGSIDAESKTEFKTPGLSLKIPEVQTLLRPTAVGTKSQELLVKFDIPKGKSTRIITYELQK